MEWDCRLIVGRGLEGWNIGLSVFPVDKTPNRIEYVVMVTMMVQRIATEHVARLHSAMGASEGDGGFTTQSNFFVLSICNASGCRI
jgi:hypothetical protein